MNGCIGCIGNKNKYTNRPNHPFADCNGWVSVCQIMKDEEICPLMLAKKAMEIRLLELKRESYAIAIY